MKKKGLSMNLIMALTLTAVAVSVLLCVNLVFMQTYRQTLLRNAETTSRQAIAQAGSTMNEYLEDMNDAVTLLTGYLELPAEEREARFEAFLEIRADVVAVTTYDAEGEMRNCYSLGRRLREDILQNLSFDPDKRELYETGFISAPHVMSIFVEDYPWVVTIIRPSLTREGERYIAVDVSCSNISTYISGVGIGQRGYCFLEDTEGNLVYHPQQQLIYSDLKSENTALTASLPDGTHVEGSTIYTVQTLENGIWRVVGVSSFQELITDALREIMRITFIGALFILAAAVLLSLMLSRVLSSPIHDLIVAMQSFEKSGEGFSYEPVTGVREVENLSASFDHMVKKIQKLMATVRSEEVNLRKTELKALQAQINPHFLYNTLDSISWMCERGKNAEAVVMVNALARLFRISISKGHELDPHSQRGAARPELSANPERALQGAVFLPLRRGGGLHWSISATRSPSSPSSKTPSTTASTVWWTRDILRSVSAPRERTSSLRWRTTAWAWSRSRSRKFSAGSPTESPASASRMSTTG